MHAVIVANAPELNIGRYIELVHNADVVIAADGGALPLLRAGQLPDIVIGDLDSLDLESEAELVRHQVQVRRYAREKDETDFELALLLAAELGATEIDVLGALGGRWDHTIANIWLLAHPAVENRVTRLLADEQALFLVRNHANLQGQAGDTISLLPLTAEVQGVTTSGLLYQLEEATLHAEQARGVSNVLMAEHANVTIRSGLLVVVQHHDAGAHQWNARRPTARSNADE